MAFTVVFDGNLRAFKGNPMTTETPFGMPVVIGLGDACETTDLYLEALELIAEGGGSGAKLAQDAIDAGAELIAAELAAARSKS